MVYSYLLILSGTIVMVRAIGLTMVADMFQVVALSWLYSYYSFDYKIHAMGMTT